jgi:hypothetical protein
VQGRPLEGMRSPLRGRQSEERCGIQCGPIGANCGGVRGSPRWGGRSCVKSSALFTSECKYGSVERDGAAAAIPFASVKNYWRRDRASQYTPERVSQ